ncbi:MAG: YiiX/YebB-like N1pC/P60 family cysteine hydrolase, partial [Methylophagaceae bacterium]
VWSLIYRYLTIRAGFWEIIDDMSAHFSDELENVKTIDDWRHFLLGYASSCQAVYMARLLINELASHRLVQRKINEGAPQHRISPKVFTKIYRSLSDTDNAMKMQYMMNLVDANRDFIQTLEKDEIVSVIVKNLPALEKTLHPSQLAFIKLRLKYLWHALTRRGAITKKLTSFFLLEQAGRVISDIGIHDESRVTPAIQEQLANFLQAGDVLITRHDFVASNLFLPGYWPHAALYIGSETERDELGVELDDKIAKRWNGEIRTLEAQKDGVLFRPLAETLEVDEIVVLRSSLDRKKIAKALGRAVQHEGKGYNFDFDFFSSDQLVCTEVVFRAYDGLGELEFELIERAGRLSLSAEDLLDMAMNQKGFTAVACYGFEGCQSRLVTGDDVSGLVRASY